MNNSWVDLFFVFWFLLTALYLCFWIIGNAIHDATMNSIENLQRIIENHRFLCYCVVFVLFCLVLNLVALPLGSKSECCESIAQSTIFAMGGGLFASISFYQLQNVYKAPDVQIKSKK